MAGHNGRPPLKPTDFWRTPPDLYPKDCFDPCPVNPQFDGLEIPWHGDVFCNPPYSQARYWIEKAIAERANCKSIVMLLPNWTDRKWFQLIKDFPIEFLQGKRYFLAPNGEKRDVARWGSMLVRIK
jgi:hypothetical protein